MSGIVRKAIATLLAKFLGRYIEGIEKKNLDVSFAGNLELNDLRLRDDAFDDFELPIVIQSGYLQTIKISIPWMKLNSKPSIIEISDLYILSGPKDCSQSLNPQDIIDKLWKTKQRILQLSELSSSNEEEKKDDSSSKLSLKILSNLNICIKNVHIRYQNSNKLSYAFGLTLGNIIAKPVNKSSNIIKKNINNIQFDIMLNHFALYWNSFESSPPPTAKQDVIDFLKAQIYMSSNKDNQNTPMKYLIHPLCGKATCFINNTQTKNTNINVTFDIPHLNIILNENQYHQMQNLFEFFHNYSKSYPYLKFRPKNIISKSPMEWWIFLFKALKQKNNIKSWSKTKQFIRDKKLYVNTWQEHKIKPTKQTKERLEILEKKYDIDDILLFREITVLKKNQIKPKSKFFSFGKNSKKIVNTMKDPPINSQYNFKCNIGGVCFSVQNTDLQNIITTEFSKFEIGCLIKGGETLISSSMNRITIRDCFTENSCFPNILYHSITNYPVFHTKILLSPKKQTQYNISTKIQPITFVAAPKLFQRLHKFIQPKLQEQSIKDIELQLFLEFQKISNQAQKKVKQILQMGNIFVGIQLDIWTPTILLPEDLSNPDSSLLSLSFGQFSLQNDNFSKMIKRKEELLKNNPNIHDISDDIKHLLYYKYNITITDIQSKLFTIRKYANNNPAESIFDSFSSQIGLNICTIYDINLPIIKFNINTPCINIKLTSFSLSSIRLIIDSLLSSTDSSLDSSNSSLSIVNAIEQYQIAESLLKKSNVILPETKNITINYNIDNVNIIFEDDKYLKDQNQFSFLLSLKSIKGLFNNTSYHSIGQFSIKTLSLNSYINNDKTTKINLLSSSCNEFNISNDLQLLKDNNENFITIKYESIPKQSPIYKDTLNNIIIHINQIILFNDLIVLDGLYRLINRSLKDYSDRGNSNKNVKNVVKTSQEVIKTLVSENNTTNDINFLFKSKLYVKTCIILLPSNVNNIEFYFSQLQVNSSLSTCMDNISCSGQLGKTIANIPLLENELYYPHTIFLKGTSETQPFSFDVKLSFSDNNIDLNLFVSNPRLIIPTKERGDHILIVNLGDFTFNFKDLESKRICNISLSHCSIISTDNIKPLSLIQDTNITTNITQYKDKNKYPLIDIISSITPIKVYMDENIFIRINSLRLSIYKLSKIIDNAIHGNKDICEEISIPVETIYDKSRELKYQIKVQISSVSLKYNQDNNISLTKIELQNLNILLCFLKNEQINMNLSVNDLILQDSRIYTKDRFCKDMITHTLNNINGDYAGSILPQLKINGSLFPDKSKIIHIYFDKTYFIIIPDFWASIIPSLLNIQNILEYNKPPKSKKPTPKSTQDTLLDLKLVLIQPEINILENPDKNNTPALIIQSSKIELQYHSLAGGSMLQIHITEFQFGKCIINLRNATFISLLYPLNISITNAISNGDNSNSTKINIDKIDATFSFRDYKLLLNIYENAMPSIQILLSKLITKEKQSEIHITNDFIKDTKKIVSKTIGEAHIQLKQFASTTINENKYQGEKLEVKIIHINVAGARLVLINDSIIKTRYNPVLMIHINPTIILLDWIKGIICEFSSSLSLDYYNTNIEVWEPLLEPWNVNISFIQSDKQTQLSIDSDPIELNLTKIFLDSLELGIKVLKDATLRKSSSLLLNDNIDIENNNPYYIKNECGLPIWFSVSALKAKTRLNHNEERPLLLDPIINSNTGIIDNSDVISHQISWKERQKESHQELYIQLEDSNNLLNNIDHIYFHKIGTHKLDIKKQSNHDIIDISNIATVDVSYRNGSKIITIRSNIIIENHCDTNIDILISALPLHNAELLTINADSTLAIPVKFIENGEFSIAPSITHQFCDPILLSSSGIIGSCKAEKSDSAHAYDYFIWVSIEKQIQDRIIHLLPPIIVTNALPISIHCIFRYKTNKSKCDYQIIDPNKKILVHLADLSKKIELGCVLDSFGESENFISINIRNEESILDSLYFYDDLQRKYLIRCEILTDPITQAKEIILYSDYLIINQIGLPLLYSEYDCNNIIAGQENSDIISFQGDPSTWYISQSPQLPFLYSNDNKRNPIRIKITDSEWSDPIELTADGMVCFLSIKGTNENKVSPLYETTISVKRNIASFWRTRTVYIAPKYLLINQTEYTILYKQAQYKYDFKLLSNQQIPFHWPDKELLKLLSIKKDNFRWSSPFAIHELGKHHIKLRNAKGEYSIISVNIKLEKISNVTLIIIKENTEYPDLLIHNQLPYSITINQLGCLLQDTINEDEQIAFAWDELDGFKKIVEISVEGCKVEVSFDKLMKKNITLPINGCNFPMTIIIEANGPTRVLRLCLIEIEEKIDIFSNSVVIDELEFVDIGNNNEALHPLEIIVFIRIKHLGISIINNKPQEVLYSSISNIDLNFTSSTSEQCLYFTIGKIQIDNQHIDTGYPIFIYPINNNNLDFSLQLIIIKDAQIKSIDYFKYFFLSIGELDIKADEEIVETMISLSNTLTNTLFSSKEKQETSLYFTVSPDTIQQMKMFFFDKLIINPIVLHLTTHFGSGLGLSQNLPLGGVIGTINDAVINLKGLDLHNPFVSKDELITIISKHYKQALLSKIYKIIGSVEILGDPLSLISNMGTGVSDFFTEPVKAITSGPADFGLGLKKGTSSLVHKSAYGIAKTAGNITGGIANLASVLTFDEEFKKNWSKTYLYAREQPSQGSIIQTAASTAGSGVYTAVVDVVNSPLEGARTGGASGALVGTLKGTSGVIVKPFVSIIGATSILAQGLGNSFMNWEQQKERVRYPRYIGEDGVLRLYNSTEAIGHLLLQKLNDGKYKNEWYQLSFQVTEGTLILTNKRILITKDYKIFCDVPFSIIRGFQLTKTNIIILPNRKETTSFFSIYKTTCTKVITPIIEEQNEFDISPLYDKLITIIQLKKKQSYK